MSLVRRRRNRKGNIVYTVSAMLTLMGFGAITIDLARQRQLQLELMAQVDAAAHAAGNSFSPSDQDTWDSACATAAVIAEGTKTSHNGLNVNWLSDGTGACDSSEFTFGNYEDGVFTAFADTTVDGDDVVSVDGVDTGMTVGVWVNAVRAHKESEVGTIFGFAAGAGFDTVGAGHTAITMVQSGTVYTLEGCYLPLAIPDCWFDGTHADIEDINFSTSPATTDNIGWALDGSSNPNNNAVSSQLEDIINGTCDDVSVDEDVSLNNGINGTGVGQPFTLMEYLVATMCPTAMDEAEIGAWPGESESDLTATEWGCAYTGQILLFSAGGADGYDCAGGNPTWTQDGQYQIAGFATVDIYNIDTTDGDRELHMRIDTTQTIVQGTVGDSTTGTGVMVSTPPTIVQ